MKKQIIIIISLFIANAHALDMFQAINKHREGLKNEKYSIHHESSDIFSKFKNKFSLEFIYSSQCGFCHKLSYVLNELKAEYGISIHPVTVDGGSIIGFENPVYDPEFIKLNDIKAFPTLIAKNKNNQRYLIAQGFISKNELKNNIETLLDYVKGEGNA